VKQTIRLFAGLTGLLSIGYAPVVAQSSLPVSVGAMSAIAFRNSSTSAGTEKTNGLVVGVGGTVRFRRFSLEVSYLEGSLSSGAANAGHDLVEGELLVGVYPMPWLAVKTGVHIRSFVTGAIAERWVLWEGRVQAEGELYAPHSETFSLHSYAAGWYVVSGDASLVDRYDGGSGAEAGMIVRLTGKPFQARLAYRVDHDQLAGGARQETVETLVLGVGVSLRR
jgi:hypothetical protein